MKTAISRYILSALVAIAALGSVTLGSLSGCGGYVTPDPVLYGTVVNAGGSPIAGAIVDLAVNIISTPENGTFTQTFPGSAVEFTIVIRKEGYNTYMEKLHIEGGDPMTKQFVLTAWTADSGLTGTLQGYIKCGDSGQPIQGATVTIEGTSLTATTDAEGFYKIENVPSGEQRLLIDAAGYIPEGPYTWIFDNFVNVYNENLTPDE